MTDPYRAMCAELLAWAEHTSSHYYKQPDVLNRARALLAQAVAQEGDCSGCEGTPVASNSPCAVCGRIALAHPEPVVPTDEEIMELMPQQMREDLAAAARALAGFDRANVKAAGAMRIILNRHAVNHARAVLSRYSHQ